MEQVLSHAVGFVLGTVSGLMAPDLLRRWRIVRGRFRSRRSRVGGLESFDAHQDGFAEINSWSTGRRLTPRAVQIEYIDEQPEQDWCAPEDLARLRSGVLDAGGDSHYLVDFAIDHRESAGSQTFKLTLAPSTFADYRAVKAYFAERPREAESLWARASGGGLQTLIRTAPPSVTGMHVNVVSADKRFLTVRRSQAVAEHRGEWMMGAGETMVASSTPGAREDFFSLGRRALDEEVGLRAHEGAYGHLFVSWFGIRLSAAMPLVIGHVQSELTHREIDEHITQADGYFEQMTWRWRPLTAAHVRMTAEEMRAGLPDRWAPGSRLILRELWRYRHVLAS